MAPQLCLLQFALSELFAQVSNSGKVTLADQYGLLAALLTDRLNEDEQYSIDRLLYAVAKGRVQVVNEISFLPSYGQ